jgi:hypothetical protein
LDSDRVSIWELIIATPLGVPPAPDEAQDGNGISTASTQGDFTPAASRSFRGIAKSLTLISSQSIDRVADFSFKSIMAIMVGPVINLPTFPAFSPLPRFRL